MVSKKSNKKQQEIKSIQQDIQEFDLFSKLKNSLYKLDPVAFAETMLSLDGDAFRLHGNGFKPFADIYRYIGLKAIEPNSKPVVLTKSRQTGGTTMACVLEMYFMGCGFFGTEGRYPIRILHAFPQLELAASYSKTKLGPMISSSMLSDVTDSKGKRKAFMESLMGGTDTSNSLSFKEFTNGNHIWIDSVGITGDRIRGKTLDVIFFDECQDMTELAIGTASKTLIQAKYGNSNGVQIFFGTPKGKGSPFHKIWMNSSQQYYYLGCLNKECQKHFPLYTPESDDWEKTWLHGYIVKCPHCGFEQDKRLSAEKGKWFALNKEEDVKYIGFHINQIYMPKFTKEDIIGLKPENNPLNTTRVYQNEVMGEFFQGDTSPISIEEIRDNCGDFSKKFKSKIYPNQNEIVTLGIDYGAKSDIEQMANPDKRGVGQSYSTAVVLSSKDGNIFNIEYALKFKRNDPESKKGIIEQLMRNYSIQLAVGDIGFSQDFSMTLQKIYGESYLVSRAQGQIKDHVKYIDDIFPKEIMFEKDYFIGELIDKLKAGKIKFPFGNYEQIAWLVNHCASMELKPSISRSGEPTIHYVKGSTPNDGMMALLNAYLAYKFIVTDKFKNKNLFNPTQSFDTRKKPNILLAYLPNIR